MDNIKDHIWHIQPCSATTGEGLITGMKWLSDQLVFKSDNNFPINPYIDYSEKIDQENQENNKEDEVHNDIITEIEERTPDKLGSSLSSDFKEKS